MNAPRPTNPNTRVAILALVAVAAAACSTKLATDLTRSASTSERSLSSGAQEAAATYFMPEGAKPVEPVPGSVVPEYPDSLRNARVEGDVLVQFVVDTSGLVDSGSVRVLHSTHGMFTEVV